MLRNLILLSILLTMALTNLFAQQGKALLLDGNGSYMVTDNQSDLNIGSGQSFSITCWVKADQAADYMRILNKRGSTGNSSPGYELIVNKSGGQFGINLRSVSGTNAGPPFGTTSVTDGQWHHVAVVVNPATSSSKIYVDGVEEKSLTSSAIGAESFANTEKLFFGSSGGTTYFWNGWLDEVRIWSNAINLSEIQADMSAVVTGSETGLVAAWDFENEQGGIVPDLTGKHPGTLVGAAKCIEASTGEMQLSALTEYQPDIPLGAGEKNARLASLNFKTTGTLNPYKVNGLTFESSDASIFESARLYYNGSKDRLDLKTASLLATADFSADSLVFNFTKELQEGNNVFWCVTDVKEDAGESQGIVCKVSSYTLNGQAQKPDWTMNITRPVLLNHTLLFSGGDYGSASYRIPAIASRGNEVVAIADARINNNADLPNNIDLIVKHSNDGGKTWSDPIVSVDFGDSGASDPALVYDKITGDLLCLFASHNGLFASTPSNKIRFNVVRSSDFGKTWGTPKEFSDQIYLPGWYAAWVASGSAHQLESGRIVAAIGARKNSTSVISNFMIYSDDSGNTWHTAGQASASGDESKIVSTENGKLLMSIRTPGKRRASWSSDGGQTWSVPVPQNDLTEPGVNGDLIRYTAMSKGFNKNRLLFSIPYHASERRNLNVFVSYDEGNSWPARKAVCTGKSAYSALTAFDDGTIGMFYENGEYEYYQLYFAKFSLDWITNGTDIWSPAVGVTDNKAETDYISATPNPATGKVKIWVKAELSNRNKVEIFDTSGHLIKIFDLKTNTDQSLEWDTSEVVPGMYFIKLTSGDKEYTKKLSVARQ